MSADTSCRLCGSNATYSFLKRTGVPVHQNRIARTCDEARAVARGDLQMCVCGDCNFIFNAAFDSTCLSYDDQYDNSQTFSPTFSDYVDELVGYLLQEQNVRGKRIVEIGCGKGAFLTKLVTDPQCENTGWGFDPTYVGPTSTAAGCLQFVKSFFDEATAIAADVIVCRHVIEHVPRPAEMIASIYRALSASQTSGARLFFETPCVAWILRNQVIWDFFYEHCSLFTGRTLESAFRSAGFQSPNTRPIFAGQYLWLEAAFEQYAKNDRDIVCHSAADNFPAGETLRDLALAYQHAEQMRIDQWQAMLQAESMAGGVCLWGAGAKGVTLANLVDPHCELIDCIVDLNPAKQNCYLPGTGHAVISPETLTTRRVATVVVMNPNYRQEIARQLNSVAPHLKIVDLPEAKLQQAA